MNKQRSMDYFDKMKVSKTHCKPIIVSQNDSDFEKSTNIPTYKHLNKSLTSLLALTEIKTDTVSTGDKENYSNVKIEIASAEAIKISISFVL